ncbi:MAG: hypothetical protein HS104_37060 [Polyangiaceae bacterium]|nr:hypothetical protein [Polyangiaceae bacterium]
MAKLRSTLISSAFVLTLGPAALADGTLPLKRVRLYETGVGYFERTGGVNGKPTALPVPAGHLDDALKTLVVLTDDPKNGSVAGVEFGSSVSRSMARSLAGLSADDAPLNLHALLKSLKGAAVELKAGAQRLNGKLVELSDAASSDLEECVSVPAKAGECTLKKQPVVVLFTKGGELRRIKVADIASVRPTDPAYASRLGSALDALSDRSARVMKDLRVMAKGGKSVSLGYVAETPVWRVTYRLVLGDKADQKSQIQAWALLHNDTEEEWKGVMVDLVNGRPDSFLFPLAAPRYARRELVTPEQEMSTVPQLMDQTPDSMWTGDSYGAGGLGLSGIGEGGGGRGEGVGLGSIGTLGHGAGTGSIGAPGASSILSVGNLASVAPAEGVEAGAMFRYSLKQPVDLRAHGSALVPFLGDGIQARRIAFFSAAGQSARSAVHVTHQGTQTLPPGTIAVFADGGFAGEAALARMKPRETQVIEFGVDLDVELSEKASSSSDSTKLLGFERGQLVEHFVRRHRVELALENRSGSGRDVFLKLGYVNNAKVEGADELAWDSNADKASAVFAIGPRQKLEKKLTVDEGLTRRHDPTKLGSARLRELARVLPESQKSVVLRSAELALEAEVRRGALGKRRAEYREVSSEILRLREHARALSKGRGSEAVAKRLLAAEDSAKALRKRIAELDAEAAERSRKAVTVLSALGR